MVDAVEQRQAGIGISAFDILRAEEEPWLDACLVRPPHFNRFAGGRSAMIFGEPGSGKTALLRFLERHLQPGGSPGTGSRNLLVPWRPDASTRDETAALSRVLGCCANHLMLHLATNPSLLSAAPPDVQHTLAWFIRRYSGENAVPHPGAPSAALCAPAVAALRPWLNSTPAEHWLASQRPAIIVNGLVQAVRQVGLQTIYILVSPDALGESEAVQEELRALLASSTLFENSGFLYKLILPVSLEGPLARAGAAVRRRIDLYHLKWSTEQLVQIVVRRVALASGQRIAALDQVCSDPKLAGWLARTGGISPRGWLKYVAPLVDRYLQLGEPVPAKEWLALRADDPPPLAFDEDTQSVTVGACVIPMLPEVPLALLAFLWQQRPRVCSRRELYERAYVPAIYPGFSRGESRPLPVDYEHVLDTAILRLRERIEPDPRSPLYVVTVRGKGYKLEHAW